MSALTNPCSRALGLLLAAPLVLCGCESPQVEQTEEPSFDVYLDSASRAGMRIDVEFEDLDLRVAMQRISDRVGSKIRVDPDVQETVTVSLRDVPWREAVDVIARMSRCEVVERDGALLLQQRSIVRMQFTAADVRTVLQLLAAYQGKKIELPDDLQGEIDVDLVVAEGAIQAVLDQVGGYRAVQGSEEGDPLRVVAVQPDGS